MRLAPRVFEVDQHIELELRGGLSLQSRSRRSRDRHSGYVGQGNWIVSLPQKAGNGGFQHETASKSYGSLNIDCSACSISNSVSGRRRRRRRSGFRVGGLLNRPEFS